MHNGGRDSTLTICSANMSQRFLSEMKRAISAMNWVARAIKARAPWTTGRGRST